MLVDEFSDETNKNTMFTSGGKGKRNVLWLVDVLNRNSHCRLARIEWSDERCVDH